MKINNINEHLTRLNQKIDSLQEEADFFFVMYFFEKIQELQKKLYTQNPDHTSIGIKVNPVLSLAISLLFDQQDYDMPSCFRYHQIELQKGWKNAGYYIDFSQDNITITRDMSFDNFVKAFTIHEYQKKYSAYQLDNHLVAKPDNKKPKI